MVTTRIVSRHRDVDVHSRERVRTLDLNPRDPVINQDDVIHQITICANLFGYDVQLEQADEPGYEAEHRTS